MTLPHFANASGGGAEGRPPLGLTKALAKEQYLSQAEVLA
jgi:hypothetical protein